MGREESEQAKDRLGREGLNRMGGLRGERLGEDQRRTRRTESKEKKKNKH